MLLRQERRRRKYQGLAVLHFLIHLALAEPNWKPEAMRMQVMKSLEVRKAWGGAGQRTLVNGQANNKHICAPLLAHLQSFCPSPSTLTGSSFSSWNKEELPSCLLPQALVHTVLSVWNGLPLSTSLTQYYLSTSLKMSLSQKGLSWAFPLPSISTIPVIFSHSTPILFFQSIYPTLQ